MPKVDFVLLLSEYSNFFLQFSLAKCITPQKPPMKESRSENIYSSSEFIMSNALHHGHGFNLIQGDHYDNQLKGTHQNDKIIGKGGDDKLFGKGGHDKLFGDAGSPTQPHDHAPHDFGNDKLWGGDGNDKLYGGWGNDKLFGEHGNDKLFGEQGNDKLDGGKGNDKLWGGKGHDQLFGGKGNDELYGGKGDDELWGGKGDDKLYGEDGNDSLVGGKGHDKLKGGHGHDRLNGFGTHQDPHTQYDKLFGGAGYDTFILGGKDWGVSYFEEGDGYAKIMDWTPRQDHYGYGHQAAYDQIEVYDAYYWEGGHAPNHAPHGHDATYRGYSLKFTYSHGIGEAHKMDTEIHFTNRHGQTDRIGIVVDSTNVDLYRDFNFV